MQAHFVGFIEIASFRADGIEARIDIQQVGVVLVSGAEAMDHQLCQGHGGRRRCLGVLPTGEGFQAALRGVESVEVHLIRVEADDVIFFQQVAGNFVRRVLQAGARLDDGGGDCLERRLVGGIGQWAGFDRVHALYP
ncbi:hypothetical protein PSH88_06175 [Pseudomonas wuhanensis]|uniref:Uncharacterized protein n=1 Tax=Pseudomonas wuhanensis TaxID=2954098 RepID=A0ABY9GV42_9PSED|nr:hypothetical protein [Pseudomonas sp. FP607]WLI19622.1 hypothetical protein PSH88_06175 [Pseudomonas sp. FP607]